MNEWLGQALLPVPAYVQVIHILHNINRDIHLTHDHQGYQASSKPITNMLKGSAAISTHTLT